MLIDIPTRIKNSIEIGRIVRPCLPCYYAPTNDPFTSFRMAYNDSEILFLASSDGGDIFDDGVRCPLDSSPVGVFVNGILEFYSTIGLSGYSSPGRIVYWRKEPEVTLDLPSGMTMIYARLAITDHLDEKIKYWRDNALELQQQLQELREAQSSKGAGCHSQSSDAQPE